MDKKKLLTLFIILFISAMLIFIQVKPQRKGTQNIAEKAGANIISPVQSFFSDTGKRISTTWNSLTRVSGLEEENKKLQAEIAALKEEQEEYNRTREENRHLRKMLEISKIQKGKVIAAEIIARDPDNWFEIIKINRGFKHGVSKDMIALSSEGLVGRVVDASEYTARIRLIFDEKSAVPAQIVSTGDLGVVYGEGSKTCIMKYIDDDAKIKVGDQVVTSNLSNIYPPGKIIGRVSKLYGRDQVLYQAVQVKPSVQFRNLEFVLLIGRN